MTWQYDTCSEARTAPQVGSICLTEASACFAYAMSTDDTFGTTCGAAGPALIDLHTRLGPLSVQINSLIGVVSMSRRVPNAGCCFTTTTLTPALRRHDGDKSRSTRASCRRRPRPCVVPRQRSAPSATLAQLAELTSGRRHACKLTDAETF